VSDQFTWKPATSPPGTSSSLRVAVVVACAAIGIVAGSLYPIKKLIAAIERATPPRLTGTGNPAATAVQEPRLVVPQVEAADPVPPQAQGGRPEAAPRVVLLNRVSDEPKVTPKASAPMALSKNRSAAPSHNPDRQHTSANARGDRNVLVVVRRRGPPYDTKILQGRIRGGKLIVDARGLTVR
jgi:hypothetical protein